MWIEQDPLKKNDCNYYIRIKYNISSTSIKLPNKLIGSNKYKISVNKALINQENAERKAQNEQNERDNALAIAQYKAAIKAAERMTFPTQNFTDLVTDYNRLLTHHDI